MSIQEDANKCIYHYRNQYKLLEDEIELHGLPIRVNETQKSFIWKFNDGYELSISKKDVIFF